jgi:hypothetical protein
MVDSVELAAEGEVGEGGEEGSDRLVVQKVDGIVRWEWVWRGEWRRKGVWGMAMGFERLIDQFVFKDCVEGECRRGGGFCQ